MNKYEQIVLALLGRIAFPSVELRAAIGRNKRDADSYLRGYNACDGGHTVAQIAKVVGVTSGTLVPILQQWERMGIVFELETRDRGKFYRHLYTLEE